mmetsp:Transcript_14455/g.27531  ORF Transcript_14455/g.27531 Transcript_14455/m.27531 type:complete len:180 (+) Transcript_14455:82-621(+)|eukprot:scaffold6420_cov168-Amphora_coffeaeformis.AAC.35
MFLGALTKVLPRSSRLANRAVCLGLPHAASPPTAASVFLGLQQLNCASFSTGRDEKGLPPPPAEPIEKPTYVHPLSQIVLEHLQKSHSDFLTEHGLDNLDIRSDGTFTLSVSNDEGKIFTFFDPEEKKHWLTVQKGKLVGRYMLQDNMKPAWHSDKRSTPEKIQDGVDDMILKLSQPTK